MRVSQHRSRSLRGGPTAGQRSFVTLGVTLVLALVSCVEKNIVDLAGPLPKVRVPVRNEALYSYSKNIVPPADLEIDLLIDELRDPTAVSEFLQQRASFVICPDFLSFVSGYRLSIAEFQERDWIGDCNDLTGFMCEASFQQGYQLGVLTMWPRRWQDRFTKEWHQIAVLCVRRGKEHILFDNGKPIRWNGTLDQYAESIGKAVLPIGGKVNWRPTKPNPLARFFDHLRPNTELKEHKLPTSTQQLQPSMI